MPACVRAVQDRTPARGRDSVRDLQFDAHHARPSHGRRDYLGQVDYFAIYCPETNGVYLVPIEEMTARAKGSLRVTPAQDGQRRRVRLADDYEVWGVCMEATRAPRGTSGAR